MLKFHGRQIFARKYGARAERRGAELDPPHIQIACVKRSSGEEAHKVTKHSAMTAGQVKHPLDFG